MEHAFTLVPDKTLAIQLGLFLLSYVSLRHLVFKPYVKLLHSREEMTTGLKQKSLRDREKAMGLEKDYELFMQAEKKKISSWADERRKKILEEERVIIQAARNQVSAELKELRVKLKGEMEGAKKTLIGNISDFASRAASKLIGQKVQVSDIPLPTNMNWELGDRAPT